MAIKFEVTRPDDLLSLTIQGDNLRLDTSVPESPALVVENAQLPAFLTVVFPPQTIAETAFFESSIVPPESNRPDTDPPTTTDETSPGPGNVKARIAHPSRLVFKVPPQARIPFTMEGVLDWSALEVSVNPIAAIPPQPSPAQIAAAPAIAAPTPNQTALELPYKLIVSPNPDVRWAHRLRPFTSRGRTELWHTGLQLVTPLGPVELSPANPAPLRAIFSEDYNPIHPPDRIAKDLKVVRTAMSPNDRHQIVILTSAFHGYEVDEEFLVSLGAGGLRERFSFKTVPMKFTVPYVPQPFFADQLVLSSLGGWLRSRGHWNPPRTVKPRPPLVFTDFATLQTQILGRVRPAAPAPLAAPPPALAAAAAQVSASSVFDLFSPDLVSFLFPRPEQEQLDLSEWVHIATQGREHYVRIVYEGELWPIRNRAALIKVTERKFKEQNGLIIAYLFQHMFIVVREPVKLFAASDRGMPFKRVRLTTLVPPDIADPDKIPTHIPLTQRSFWVSEDQHHPPRGASNSTSWVRT